jgi:hypothetical protein
MHRAAVHIERLQARQLLSAFTAADAAWQVQTPAYTLFAYDRPTSVGSLRRELWRTDGTARRTTYLGPLDASRDPFPGRRAPQGLMTDVRTSRLASGRDVFTAFVPDGFSFRRPLWTTDGTLAGTRSLFGDTRVGPVGDDTSWVNYDGTLYGVGAERAGYPSMAWRSDGTAAGTRPLAFSAFARDVVAVGRDAFTLRPVLNAVQSPDMWWNSFAGFDVYRYVGAGGVPVLYDSVRYTAEQIDAGAGRDGFTLSIVGGNLVAFGGRFAYQIDGTPRLMQLGTGPLSLDRTRLPDRNAEGPVEAMVLIPDGIGVVPLFTRGTPESTFPLPVPAGEEYWVRPALDRTTLYALSSSRDVYAVDLATRRLRWSEPISYDIPPDAYGVSIDNLRFKEGSLKVDLGWWVEIAGEGVSYSTSVTARRAGPRRWVEDRAGDPGPLDTFGALPNPGDLGTLRGRAFADVNSNGRRDAGETWLGGSVRVESVVDPAVIGYRDSDKPDQPGPADFGDVPAGRYRAVFQPDDRTAAPLIDTLRPAVSATVRFDVVGGRTTSIDIPVRVAPVGRGAISVNVFFDLLRDGRPDSPQRGGIDEIGDPLAVDHRYWPDPRAVVRLERFVDGRRAGSTSREWTSDEPMRFDRLPAGRYFVALDLGFFETDGRKMPVVHSGRSSFWIDVPAGASERAVDLGYWASTGSKIVRRLVKDYNNNGRRDGDDVFEMQNLVPAFRVDPVTGLREPVARAVMDGIDPLLPGEYVLVFSDAPERRITLRANTDVVYDEIIPYARLEATPYFDRNSNGRTDAGEEALNYIYRGSVRWGTASTLQNVLPRYFDYRGETVVIERPRPRPDARSVLEFSVQAYVDDQFYGYFAATVPATLRMNGIQRIDVALRPGL